MQGSKIDPIVAVQRIVRPMAVFFPLCSCFSAFFLCYDHKHIIGDINKYVSIIIFRVEFPEVDFFRVFNLRNLLYLTADSCYHIRNTQNSPLTARRNGALRKCQAKMVYILSLIL